MRRIKMLEYALRVERYLLPFILLLLVLTCFSSSKQLTQPSIPVSKSAQTQGNKEDKEGSSGSSPRSEGLVYTLDTVNTTPDHRKDSSLPHERSQPNGAAATGPPSRPQTWAGAPNWQMTGGPSTANSLGKPPPGRDPKSRARSREYLKQFVF